MANTMSWIFWLIISTIGVLNVFLVHAVPGLLYLTFSLIYFPPFDSVLRKRFNFSIPCYVKIILGFVVLWATLGVGDLFELFESRIYK